MYIEYSISAEYEIQYDNRCSQNICEIMKTMMIRSIIIFFKYDVRSSVEDVFASNGYQFFKTPMVYCNQIRTLCAKQT